MNKFKLLLIGVLSSLLLLIFFQNCSKNQALYLESSGEVTVNNSTEEEEEELPSDPSNPSNPNPPSVNYKGCLVDGVERPHLWTSWGLKNKPPQSGSNNETCDLFELHQCIDGNINPLQIADGNKKSCITPPVSNNTSSSPCTIFGRIVPHGHVALLFNTPSASQNQNCLAQIKRCENGNFSGESEYSNLTCMESNYKPTSGTAQNCQWEDLVLPDGSAMVFFKEQNPNGNCEMQARRCIQGRLSGRFTFLSCNPKVNN